MLYGLPGVLAERVLLVSLGKAAAFDEATYREALAGAAERSAGERPADDAVVTLADLDVPGRASPAWRVETASRILADSAYRFVLPDRAQARGRHEACAASMLVIRRDAHGRPHHRASPRPGRRRGHRAGQGPRQHARQHLHPALSGAEHRSGTRPASSDSQVEVLERDDIEKLGMGAFLAVGRTSHSPCKLIVHALPGGRTGEAKPIVLVGKGITFDTGGVVVRSPGANLDEMKFDMSGAGSVLGAMKTVARLGLPLNVVGHRRSRREHAGRRRGPAGRRRHVHVGPDDRDPEHRCRRPARCCAMP